MVHKLWILDPKIKISSPFQPTNSWSEFQTWFSNSIFHEKISAKKLVNYFMGIIMWIFSSKNHADISSKMSSVGNKILKKRYFTLWAKFLCCWSLLFMGFFLSKLVLRKSIFRQNIKYLIASIELFQKVSKESSSYMSRLEYIPKSKHIYKDFYE